MFPYWLLQYQTFAPMLYLRVRLAFTIPVVLSPATAMIFFLELSVASVMCI